MSQRKRDLPHDGERTTRRIALVALAFSAVTAATALIAVLDGRNQFEKTHAATNESLLLTRSSLELTRRMSVVSLRPIASSKFVEGEHSLEWFLGNLGSGVAEIRAASLYLDGSPVDTWAPIFTNDDGVDVSPKTGSEFMFLIPPVDLAPGVIDGLRIMSVNTNAEVDLFMERWRSGRIVLELCICSLLDQCRIYIEGGHDPSNPEVDSCPDGHPMLRPVRFR